VEFEKLGGDKTHPFHPAVGLGWSDWLGHPAFGLGCMDFEFEKLGGDKPHPFHPVAELDWLDWLDPLECELLELDKLHWFHQDVEPNVLLGPSGHDKLQLFHRVVVG
jgi:hypothetical protein